MTEVINLPDYSKQVVAEALVLYKKHIETTLNLIDEANSGSLSFSYDHLNNLHFDLIGLIGVFKEKKADIEIRIDSTARATFCGNHNVDFPLWDGVDE
jgi:hypothetical protein|tara:strand:- start:121 stop:414 length:294 start_codon:yes stop_codon:yes gene_type:complete